VIRRLAAACLAALAVSAAAGEFLSPPPALVLDGVPPVPAEVARKIAPYGEFRPHALLAWHPTKRAMLVRRRLEATAQVHLLDAPGATPRPLTDFPDPVASAAFEPTRGESFVFAMGRGGNEVYRLHRLEVATGALASLSPEGERVGAVAWNRQGDRIAYTTEAIDRNNPARRPRTTLFLADPANPGSAKELARFDSGGWGGLSFSEDGRRLVLVQSISSAESHLWVVAVPSGAKRRVTTRGKHPVAYAHPHFTKDGKALYATSDRGSEFRRLVRLPLAGGDERVLTGHIARDVDDFAVSFDAGRIAFLTNEDGGHVLRFLDLETLKEQPRPPLFDGVIGGLAWRPGSHEIGFHIASARSPGDVFSYDIDSNQITRWTRGNNPAVNTRELPEPKVVRWKSFDAREVSGLLYAPPARFSGRRPVIVKIHGGPASQARPGFLGRDNYFLAELGVAMIYPNVRGSAGFGKTFLGLDDGRRREDAVRDIGALLDWIRDQPELDADRVLVMGGSYGGYVALACAAHFPERIAGAVSTSGISSFVTFLERTESYHRDRRRAEYGDERDPAMRAFLESISPLAQAGRIAKPLLIAQGLNDPRVPHTEAEQIVASLKARGASVSYVLAKDEGHGFVRKPNADYLFYAIAEFARGALRP